MSNKVDKILFVIGLILIAIFIVGITSAFSANVKSDNDNSKGYVFVGTGETQGKTQIGTWTDAKFLKGEKGDKGDRGLQGIQGIQGIQGLKGDVGLSGKDGLNGLNGVNGEKGDKGDKGDKGNRGLQGIAGADGIDGLNGIDGITPIKGIDYFDGLNGADGLNGKDFDPIEVTRLDNRIDTSNISITNETSERKNVDTKLQNNINNVNSRVDDVSNRVSALEKTQVIAELGVRIFDTKHLSAIPYLQQNFTRQKVSEVGVKILIKIGKSYEEKLIEDTNSRVKALENKMGGMPIITRVVDKKGNLISVRIEENGLSVGRQF